MHCYRYVTPALKGRWRRSREEALRLALLAGQAFERDGSIHLFEFAELQSQPDYRCLEECSVSSAVLQGEQDDLQRQDRRCRSAGSVKLDMGASRAVDKPSQEELRRRSELHHIDRARSRILQKVARGQPVNVFERKLIAGELPPGL